jgi:geranylgeranyl diphosphate synthase type II
VNKLKAYMESNTARVDRLLEKLFASKAQEPEAVRKAMSYSIFAGGKRLRPTLVTLAAECCGLAGRKVLKTAASLEMIHTYSLIHDDLPAMDDDDLRRGKPTNHKVFGEALAILAGDGLLTYAFETAALNALELRLPARASAELVRVIAQGAGTRGMVGGQVADLQAENWKSRNHGFDPKKALEYIHLHKTGALIVASLEAGAVLAQAPPPRRKALRAYGRAIGLAFQIADDILDVVGDKKKLGKKGSDAQNNKLTYVTLYGIDEARKKAASLVAQGQKQLKIFKPAGRANAACEYLRELAQYIIIRDK